MADLNNKPILEPTPVTTTNTSNSVNTNNEVKQEENKKEDKKDKKGKKDKKPRRPFKVVMKTWSKGLQKEAGRITWEKKSQVLKDFVTIVVVCVFFALIFFGIDMLLISIRR